MFDASFGETQGVSSLAIDTPSLMIDYSPRYQSRYIPDEGAFHFLFPYLRYVDEKSIGTSSHYSGRRSFKEFTLANALVFNYATRVSITSTFRGSIE